MDDRVWEVCERLVERRRRAGMVPVLPDRWFHLVEHLCRHSRPQEVEPYMLAILAWVVALEVDARHQR